MIRLFKSKIYISAFALVLFAVTAISDDAVFFFIAVLGAIFHEAAHVGAMKLCGVSVAKISVYPFGADICADISEISCREEAFIAACGPLVSLAVSAICYVLWRCYGGIYVFSSCVSNFLFFLVNFFPVRGLDGGRIVFALLLSKFDVAVAYKIFAYISTVGFGALCVFALFALYISGYNVSLVFICGYLFVSQYIKCKMC